AGIINLRMPYQGNAVQRKMINNGEISYIDQHLSHTAEQIRQGVLGDIDYAVIEAAAITEEGLIIPTGSVGTSPIFVQEAGNVIIQLNLTATKEYESLQDNYIRQDEGKDSVEIPVLN